MVESGLFGPPESTMESTGKKYGPVPTPTIYHHPASTMETEKWMRRSGRTRIMPTVLPRILPNSSAQNPADSIQQYLVYLHSDEKYLLIFILHPGTHCSPYRVCEVSLWAGQARSRLCQAS